VRVNFAPKQRILLALAGFVLLLALAGCGQRGKTLPPPRLIAESAGGLNRIGARGPVTLEFPDGMRAESVESRLIFDPPIEGRFTWDGSGQSLSFWPARPLLPGQRFSVRLAAQAESTRGIALTKAQAWQVEVRQAGLLYLSPSRSPELWKVDSDGQNVVRLTNTGGKIIDYSVSFDGNWIAYSVTNDQQGVDIWEMNRQGESARLLLPCGADGCFSPAYAPDGLQIVYSRRRVSGLPGRQPETPRIWLLNRAEKSDPEPFTKELFANPNIGGSRASWSPDGRFLAFYDEISGGIRVYNQGTQQDYLLPAAEGAGIEWSPSSDAFLYLQAGLNGESPYTSVYQVDVNTQQTRLVLGNDGDFSVPAWSPDGDWAVVGQRLSGGSLTRQLWLVRLGAGSGESLSQPDRQPVTDDVLYNHAGYQWEPGGVRLVYQRLQFGSPDSLPEIGVWNRQDNQTPFIIKDAFQPLWMP